MRRGDAQEAKLVHPVSFQLKGELVVKYIYIDTGSAVHTEVGEFGN